MPTPVSTDRMNSVTSKFSWFSAETYEKELYPQTLLRATTGANSITW